MSSKTNQSRFITKLHEQLLFIEASARQYDLGTESEAIRIAVALRCIFHETNMSTPLVSYLEMGNWEMLSSDCSIGDIRAYVSFEINLTDPVPLRAIPKLGTSFRSIGLNEWWKGQVVYEFDCRYYSRKDLILSASNKDGGAHVDCKLDEYYANLASGLQSLGLDGKDLVYPNGAPYDQSEVQYCRNLHVATLRQFGHEVLVSAKHFDWLGRLSGAI